MSQKDKVDTSAYDDIRLTILIAKRNAIFEVVQKIYDLSSNIHKDAARRESFLDESANVDSLRDSFEKILDEYNERLLEVDPSGKPDYKSYVAFESLFSRIKRLRTECVQQSQPSTSFDTKNILAPNKGAATLPPIELMTFSGDIRSWPLFYASFKSTVHDNPSLTAAEKLYYLLGKLTGKAQTVCAGITPSAENYQLILQALIDKYEDKRMLASTYLNQIFDFKPLQSASAANFDLFTENFTSAVRALNNLKLNNLTDLILLHIALKRLDSDTVRAFELSTSSKIPDFEDLVEFIKVRAKILERTQSIPGSLSGRQNNNNNTRRSNNVNNSVSAPKYQAYVSTVNSNSRCLCTNIVHQNLFKCSEFNKMTPQERFNCVKDKNACVNCLSINHRVSNCSSNINCRVCKMKHHTMLHFKRENPGHPPAASAPSAVPRHAPAECAAPAPPASPQLAAAAAPRQDVALCATYNALDSNNLSCLPTQTAPARSKQTTVLLSTAQVVAYDNNGVLHIIRALLDSGSQSHFITKECCDRLGIQLPDTERTIVKGFGGTEKVIKSNLIDLKIFSRFNSNVCFNISSLVVDQVTDLLPTAMVDNSVLSHLAGLPLADKSFGVPNKVDVLIGASLFPHLFLPDVVHSSRDSSAPSALHTVLGYVVMGTAPTIPTFFNHQALTCCHAQEPVAIDSLVRRFWELEELHSTPPAQHPADVECEEFYKATTTRDPVTGRYVVGLPFNEDVYSLGNSLEIARKRFMCLERKLEASPKLRSAYDDVIKDYLDKDYIAPAPHYESRDPEPIYVIPHHGVVREDKTSTRLRIVMDASCKTSTGRSLNDILHPGPNLQGDLFKILLNFRLFAVAMTADCRQQFLQIIMREADRRYQCFLYRFSPQDPLVLYQFNRVCFGLTSSPYHALRTVRQLIDDDGAKYPLASRVASSSLYMDDLAFSLPDESEAVSASQQLIELFKGARWDLVKWNSNSQFVLNNLPASYKLRNDVEFDKSVQHKILGLHWSIEDDSFYFKISIPDNDTCTKRSILSTVARLWDIMGFVAPTVVYAKLLIKQLWLLHLDWDDVPPPSIIKMWKQFCTELPSLNELRIPRHVGAFENSVITLLGFSDASENAYGAVVYLHVSTVAGNTVQLVCAKTKVAPTKPVSIARLELCGAVLMSKLLRAVLDNYSHRFPIKTFAFIDSKVALYWIKSSPHRWQTFVANRVVQITDNISADSFFHVAGVENPADILSRGITPHKLISHPLWLHGPEWASLDPSQWPLKTLDGESITNIPEEKVLTHTVSAPVTHCVLYELASRISSWSKLLRVIVYVCRFAKLLPRRDSVVITATEIELAENKILRSLQAKHFAGDYLNIKTDKNCSPVLMHLRPFIDNGLIRVGGRLSNAALEYAQTHPVILPRNDHVVNLIIDYYHAKHLHAGPELLMSLLRQKFWILSARRIVRRRVHLCNTCFRLKPRPTYPLMADLPDSRTRQVVKAFTHTGCDYAGPIAYTPVRRRGIRSEKAYFCIFTCLTTRAVHLEVVTDLSTPTFLAAFKRFLSRRGPVQCMYSDNGTNFKGANSYLRDLYKFLNEYHKRLDQECAESRIQWKFVCPRSPHHAGAWESLVKVVKSHLFRVIGQQLLSYEELNTILVQIECLLNSRPLTVLSSDPAEPTALTPSHFLNTSPLLSLPAPAVDSDSVSLAQRHSLLDNLVQSFWARWRMEYLHSLQVRQKWNTSSTPVTPGTVVVVIDDNAPPLSWPLAIVEKVHPSKDGVVRVVTVRNARGTYLRPVVRLCPLPQQ
ncbi:hypothetical protein ABMA28_010663 [Loxostege sticticalis]|uniref:Integrase catalytic domain-containing protein n=1 Tax=Loxostege sticticalis TaxID=481309 RepID=A0ABD0S8Z4_LOXSC